ncbi:MBL fold hydrolase [Candidatus Wolfebacteria bacterium CG10_big_fil_rev_8_21_14_0_10_31_9]|uniref:MBL fold hydrolase n=1 Tax=Candidatus Wolfebacteria bacterium CG10_big_fil_rev_8_21_14_0_10_31_9 TaxID=1975070 RepID=A0A2H0REG7_9BACT|nr:MAG: MBL fold hydrolase [Candidatus Wolfebacteria bacterium CG10_big_fil_rev_8_21_14_0_10_31_9]
MKLYFYGGAKTVTGSNYLLESIPTGNPQKSTRILIDCGLFQGTYYGEDLNYQPFSYDPATIDAIFVTHAHIDHTGRIPKLIKDGFKGKIYSTGPTKDFAEQLLLDSERLLGKEAESKNLPYIYTIEDINTAMRHWQKISYHEKVEFGDFEIVFHDAGHILGSSFLSVISKSESKKIIFSGDLGNMPAPLVKDTEPIEKADYVLIESTYGDSIHEDPRKRKDKLEDAVEDTIKNKGVLLIPSFAMERTQELLYELNDLVEHNRIPPVPIFVDSPLAIRLTSIYKKYSQDPQYMDSEAIMLMKNGDEIFDFPRLTLSLTKEQSKSINDVPSPKVILAGSGMSQGGRILHHEFRYLPDPNSTILFIGYQANGSLGRQILNGASSVRIFGEDIPVHCKTVTISGYSAHADQALLMNWIKPVRNYVKKVFMVQGEEKKMLPFASKLRDEMAIDVEIPELGKIYEL